MRVQIFMTFMLLNACRGEEPGVPAAPELPPASSNAGAEELFTDLPVSIKEQIESCHAENRFYDLRTFACTDATIANFPCQADGEQLRSSLSEAGKAGLNNYLVSKDPALKLYGCTLEAKTLLMHFYRLENNQVTYNVLKLESL